MMVVKVELWPGGYEDRAWEVGRLGLANVSDLVEVSDYVAVLVRKVPGFDEEEVTTRFVAGHRRSDGFEPLVARLMDDESIASQETHRQYEEKFKSVARIMGELSPKVADRK